MDKDSSNTVLSFLLGFVSGSVAALLLAPRSDEETRKRLSEGAHKALDEASRVAQEAGHRIEEQVEKVKAYAETQKAAIKEAVEEGKGAYQREANKPQDSGQEAESAATA